MKILYSIKKVSSFSFLVCLAMFLCLTYSKIHAKPSCISKAFHIDSVKKDTARFIVSFGSICCGIDQNIHLKFLGFLGKYKNVTYSTYKWGEEGEFDYCFSLKELNEEEQKIFIKKARKILGNTRLISTYENQLCPR